MCLYVCVCMYGTNHTKLNVLRVRNGRTRTRSVPVPTKRERPFSRRFTELDDCKKCTPMYVVIPRVTPTSDSTYQFIVLQFVRRWFIRLT